MNTKTKSVKFLYISKLDFPRRVANRGQIFSMSEAFSLLSDFQLVTYKNSMSNEDLLNFYGVCNPFSILDFGKGFSANKYTFVIRLILKILIFRPNFIFCREERLAKILKLFKIDYIYEAHEFFHNKTLEQIAIVNASLLTIVTQNELKEHFIENGAAAKKIKVFNTAVSFEKFRSAKATSKLNENRSSDEIKVFYSGRFQARKGIFTSIEALKFLDKKFKLYLVGGFEGEKKAVLDFIDKHDLVGRVKIIDFVPHRDIPGYIAAADLLLVPNSGKKSDFRLENPLKLYEYLASGKPVIVSDAEILFSQVPENCVYKFKADDPEDLSKLLGKLAKLDMINHEKKPNADLFIKDHTWKNRAKKILNAAIKARNKHEF